MMGADERENVLTNEGDCLIIKEVCSVQIDLDLF